MRLPVITLGLALVAAVPVSRPAARQAPPARSPRNASYVLRADLDPATRTLTGSGRLTWRNLSTRPATELRFHLYWNAWRTPQSSWMREQRRGRNPGLLDRPESDRGSIDVTRLARSGGGNLLTAARFIAPDDGNADDRTVLAVPLEHPVAPGETVAIDLGWTAHVPRVFARTGVIGNFYFVAQWFPKIGVLEEDGWNCHQFHAATEFFADFGDYDVTLSVPPRWVAGATGHMAGETTDPAGEHTTYRFVEHDVHDFAWTTSPDLVDVHRRVERPGLPAVDIRLLLQPEHTGQADRHFDAAALALETYGSWFGAYPYEHLTVVDPVTIVSPAQGASVGGMEYPTLITAGTRWFTPWTGTQPESVTIHETGHQFWYGVVATNEFENAWMDEGLNTYSQARVMAERLPNRFVAVDRYFGGLAAWPNPDVRWDRVLDGDRLLTFRAAAGADVQSRPSWQYWPGTASQTTYGKTALWLHTLERYLGWPTVQRILATYFARGAFRHPTPDEFFTIANEVSGQDLTWFFDAVHRSAAVFDYGVQQVTGSDQGQTRVKPGSDRGQTPEERWDSEVSVRRYGDGVFPVTVRVTFEDGSTADETWDGRDRWHLFRYAGRPRVRSVEVDPDRVLLLDVDTTNNSWTAHPRAAVAAHKWAMRWLTWVEELLVSYAFFS